MQGCKGVFLLFLYSYLIDNPTFLWYNKWVIFEFWEKNMKKFISVLLLSVILLMTFSGCELNIPGRKNTALVISGTEIDRGIYAYYLDKVMSRPGDYALADNAKESSRKTKNAVKELCKRYLAINTEFAGMGLQLTTPEKVEIADRVNNYWIRAEKHYRNIGVTKQTLTKVFTSEACEEAIFSHLYDKGTSNAEGEKKIQAFYKSEYCAFRSICAYFTDADGVSISEAEKQELIDRFGNIAAASGSGFEEFINQSENAGYTASGIIIISEDSDGYPSGFYNSVSSQPENTVKVIVYGDCIFLVRKESLSSLGDEVYSQYRTKCIEKMHTEEWQKTLDGYMSRFKVEKDYM